MAGDLKYRRPAAGGEAWSNLHLPQSRIDSACGALSFLQAAMVLCGLSRSSVERIALASKPPLRTFWELASRHHFDGTNEVDIAGYVGAFEPELSCQVMATSSPKRIGAAVATAIGDGAVPLLRFESRRFSHFTTVIGYETGDGKSVSALLCLDPSGTTPWITGYNARCDLTRRAGPGIRASKGFTVPYRYCDGESWSIRLQSLVVIQRAQPP
ncbi:MAG: hypothetical protein IPP44_24920 [Ideonella sp.]|nr:hypothetical protein [Ideonella sp.]